MVIKTFSIEILEELTGWRERSALDFRLLSLELELTRFGGRVMV
jgi:hypothetical protein